MQSNRFRRRLAVSAASCLALTAMHGANAQSSMQSGASDSFVQLYGTVGTYIGTSKRSGDPKAAFVEGSGGLTTSFWGIRGREDLGGGNAMIFSLESFFQPSTGALGRKPTDPFFSRNAYMGFSTQYGTLTFGRQTNPTYVNMQELNPFGASVVFSPIVLQSFVSTYNGVLIGDTVWDNAIQYSSPSLKGLAVTGIYGVGGVAGQPGVANLGLHANYSSGPFYAGVSLQRVRTPVTAPVSEQDAWLAGMRYKLPFVTLYGAMEGSQTYGLRSSSRTYQAGAAVPTGPFGYVLAEWARTNYDTVPASHGWIRNTGALAYDYLLSKRTDVYAVCLYDKIASKGSATTFSLAIRHRF
ncbi:MULTISPECIES: porin [Burkholderiaceae]|uniref:porin n=1 Tax=Burkholderiaceae TaxID=119060 RepID=UPI001F03FE34|nr:MULTISPECIES: porin [Burkholderiaceae]